jgi:hypothetical protein
MRLNTKILTQFKTTTPLLRLSLLATLTVAIVAMLVYVISRSASDDIVVMLTPTPLAAAVTPAEEASDAVLAAVTPESVAPALPTLVFYLSLAQNSAQTIGAAGEIYDEDILSYDGADFALVFDGSAVGLPANVDVDAFDFVDADAILISFDKPVSIGQLKVDDSDIVKFEATSLGPDNTAGTFSLFLDGAAVGLTTSSENVDALTLLPDGTLLVSTEGRAKVPGLNRNIRAEKEDILAFTPVRPGDYSSGAWSLYLDGANVGIRGSSENINGLAIGPSGEIYLTTTGKFSVNDLTGSGEDIFSYPFPALENNPTSNFSPTLFFDGNSHGLKRDDVDAISIP